MVDKATSAEEGRKAGWKAGLAIVGVIAAALAGMIINPPWLYGWMKVLHLVAVISWMVGLFYMPRLFVYHADSVIGGEADVTFRIMERRLLKVIMGPAMMVSWAVGLWLAYDGFGFSGLWLWVKIAGVAGLTAFHVFLGKAVRDFAAGKNHRTARQWRMLNEIPTVLMILVIIMVVIKPVW